MKFFKSKKIVAGALCLSMVLGCVGYNVAFRDKGKASEYDSKKVSTAADRLKAARNDDINNDEYNKEVVRAIVELKSDSVADKVNEDCAEYDKNLQKQEDKIIDKQESIIKKVENITGNKVVNRSAYLVNSFSIDAKRSDFGKIAKVDGVSNIYEASTYIVEMTNALDDANVENVWNDNNYGYTGEGTVVAVIDTGVNYLHKDMKLDKGVKTKYSKEEWEEKINLLGYGAYKSEKVPFAYSYDTFENDCLAEDMGILNKLYSAVFHGYHVAGISAANGKIKGVAKNAQVLGMKVLGSGEGLSTSDAIVKAIEDAVKLGADVINMSLGLECVSTTDEEYLQKVVNEAAKAGVVCCIAASNSGSNGSEELSNTNEYNLKDTSTITTPGTASNAITVAASKNEKKKNVQTSMAYFSSWGPASDLSIKPEITAPGQDINSLLYNNKYKVMSGTSMASPYMAGCVAVLKEAINNRNMNLDGIDVNDYIKNCLMNTSKKLINNDTNPYSVRYQGAGLVDLYDAVKNNVIATCKGVAKVELGEIKSDESTTFELELKNYGDVEATYSLGDAVIYTDYVDNTNKEHKYGIKPVGGARITFDTQKVVVPANESAKVVGTVELGNNFAKNQYVEAFIDLKGQGVPSINVPVLGFYGNWSEETIIDTPVYNGVSLIGKQKGTGLTGEYCGVNTEYYGAHLSKVNVVDNNTQNCEETGSIDNNEPLSDTELNELVNTKVVKELEKENRGFKNFFSNLKDKLWIFAKEGKPYKIVNNIKGYGFAVYRPSSDGYVNIKIDAPYVKANVTRCTNDFKLDGEVFKKNVVSSYEYNLKVSKGEIYLFTFTRIDEENEDKNFGTMTINRRNDKYVTKYTKSYDGNLAAFSPNDDFTSDEVVPMTINLRNAISSDIYILDANKNKVRKIASGLALFKTVTASYIDKLCGKATPIYTDIMKGQEVRWDGTLYDSKKKEYVTAKDGQYYVQIDAKVTMDGDTQTTIMPIKIDTKEPQLDKFAVSKQGEETILTFKCNDNIGMSTDYYVDIAPNDEEKGEITFSSAYVDTAVNNNGEYYVNLGNIGAASVTLMVEDIAGNQVVSSTRDNTQDVDFDEEEEEELDIIEEEEDTEDEEVDDLFGNLFDTHDSEVFSSRVINTEDVDDNGIYHIKGVLYNTYKSIEVNGIKANFNNETKAFSVDIPVTKGVNYVTVKYIDEEDENVEHLELFYEDINLNINGINSTIKVNKPSYDLTGFVTSYTSVSKIVVNGEVVYSPLVTTNIKSNKLITTNFSKKLILNKGKNNVKVEVHSILGTCVEKYVVIEY